MGTLPDTVILPDPMLGSGKTVQIRKGNVKKQRDLYREMKRLENPNFDHIQAEELRAALNTMPQPKKAKPSKRPYQCMTQQNETLDDLFLGVNPGSIRLWESGSTINWIARSDGYPSDQHAMHAAVAMARAAQQWNEAMDGRVRFQYVTNFDDAAFQLEYGGDRGLVLASAFFPDQWQNALNTVFVYQLQFNPLQRATMYNTMLHELGHVLGLRHEHSHSGIPPFTPAEDTRGGYQSILYGEHNPRSVMAYYQGQTIQDSDVESIRLAYDDLAQGTVITGQGRFNLVKKTIERVVPNN